MNQLDALRQKLEASIEQAIASGIDVSEQIALLDDIDSDPDLEPDHDEEGLYLDRPDWQSYTWNAPRECPHCGHVHICKEQP